MLLFIRMLSLFLWTACSHGAQVSGGAPVYISEAVRGVLNALCFGVSERLANVPASILGFVESAPDVVPVLQDGGLPLQRC